jgi:hypothetical protein
MAAAPDESNEVLYIFSHLNRFEMTLIELHKNLSTRFPQITMDEVLRIIRKPNLINLFNLQPISNDLCLVQLSPKVSQGLLFEDFNNLICLVNTLRSVFTKKL